MRFATFSVAGVFLVTVLTMALWPDNTWFGGPNISVAQNQDSQEPEDSRKGDAKANKLSVRTQNTLIAEEKFREVVSLSYDQVPYAEIEMQLEEKTGLNFLLSQSAKDDSLTEDEPITFKLANMPLGKAFGLMLVEKNATYIIDSGVVIVISLDDAEDTRWMRLKMYDCEELVKALPKTVAFSGGGFQGSGPGGFSGSGVFSLHASIQAVQDTQGATAPGKSQKTNSATPDATKLLDQKLEKLLALVKAEAKKNRPVPSSEETLRNLVTNMIAPDTWMDTGQGLGQIDVVNGILIVSQTEIIHGEIEAMLKDLESHVLDK